MSLETDGWNQHRMISERIHFPFMCYLQYVYMYRYIYMLFNKYSEDRWMDSTELQVIMRNG